MYKCLQTSPRFWVVLQEKILCYNSESVLLDTTGNMPIIITLTEQFWGRHAMFKRFLSKPWVTFIVRTLAYFLIILALIYLYGYSGVTGGHFIYNEF
ncbi:teichoic acid D-Ala incorporation-associated protein DltX [Fructobacillus cardui]